MGYGSGDITFNPHLEGRDTSDFEDSMVYTVRPCPKEKSKQYMQIYSFYNT